MTDPGVLGTLRIGLDHVRAESALTDRPPTATSARTRRARGRGMSRRIAASLRRLADLLEPTRHPGLDAEGGAAPMAVSPRDPKDARPVSSSFARL